MSPPVPHPGDAKARATPRRSQPHLLRCCGLRPRRAHRGAPAKGCGGCRAGAPCPSCAFVIRRRAWRAEPGASRRPPSLRPSGRARGGPHLGPDLVAALAGLDVHDLPHARRCAGACEMRGPAGLLQRRRPRRPLLKARAARLAMTSSILANREPPPPSFRDRPHPSQRDVRARGQSGAASGRSFCTGSRAAAGPRTQGGDAAHPRTMGAPRPRTRPGRPRVPAPAALCAGSRSVAPLPAWKGDGRLPG